MLTIAATHLEAIRQHGAQTYPQECCGVVLGQAQGNARTVVALQPVQNEWTAEAATQLGDTTGFDRDRRYWIDPAALLAVMRDARSRGLDIIGFYHSHPDQPAVPSECDRELAWPDYSYLIVSVRNGYSQAVRSWCLDAAHQFQPEAMRVGAIAPLSPQNCR